MSRNILYDGVDYGNGRDTVAAADLVSGDYVVAYVLSLTDGNSADNLSITFSEE